MDEMLKAYERLAIAVVRQAALDALSANKSKRDDAKEFFRSKWFNQIVELLTELDSEGIIERMKQDERFRRMFDDEDTKRNRTRSH